MTSPNVDVLLLLYLMCGIKIYTKKEEDGILSL